ncbi:MAG: PqqD family protein [Chloroflexi bacterium]|nr:PqqD family protein [Chloroflexota bacterium]
MTDSQSGTDHSRLDALAVLLRHIQNFTRYIDYQEVERACERLAVNLLDAYDRDDLDSFQFVPIPRGGLIVVGMLAYVLDLRPEQIQAGVDTPSALVIVDDCALSGARFAQTLDTVNSDHIVFAHLYSHPDLRRNIETREPRVKRCIAAHDLTDHAREFFPQISEYCGWQERWQRRLEFKSYWNGQPDLICFPWNEPDHPFWNPALASVEDGWRFFPPHQSLKNKYKLGLPPRAVEATTWQVPSSVVSGWFDGVLWLCQTDGGLVYSLRDSAADMWRCLAVYGDIEASANFLLEKYDIDGFQLRQDLAEFASELSSKGLLEKVGRL